MVFTELISMCLNIKRSMDADVVQATGIGSAAAKILFPNVATTPAVPTEQLLEEHVSWKSCHTLRFEEFMFIRNRSSIFFK